MKNTVLNPSIMCRQNIIGVKVKNGTRMFKDNLHGINVIQANCTTYLKICWMCGNTYESKRYDSVACSPRCSNNIAYAMKKGMNPPANMDRLTKEKRVKDLLDRFGYE